MAVYLLFVFYFSKLALFFLFLCSLCINKIIGTITLVEVILFIIPFIFLIRLSFKSFWNILDLFIFSTFFYFYFILLLLVKFEKFQISFPFIMNVQWWITNHGQNNSSNVRFSFSFCYLEKWHLSQLDPGQHLPSL